MNKKNIIWVVAGIVVLIAVFYGGVSYGKSQAAATAKTAFSGTRIRGTGGNFGGATIGQILSKDAQSITLSIAGGGSKIIFYTAQTPVTKTVAGTSADLITGENVSVIGTANTDGSITAQSFQIRPVMTARPTQTTTPAQ